MTIDQNDQKHQFQVTGPFGVAFAASPAATAITSLADDTFIDVNHAFLEITGYAPDEVIGQSSVKLGLWVDRTRRAQVAKQLAQTSVLRDVEGKMRTRSGAIRDVLASFARLPIESGDAVLSVFYDVTDRKQREQFQALKASLSVSLQALEEPAAMAAIMLAHLHEALATDGTALILRQGEEGHPLLMKAQGEAASLIQERVEAYLQRSPPPEESEQAPHFLVVPLPLASSLDGAVGIYRRALPFGEESRFMLQAAAEILTSALQRAYLAQRMRRQTRSLQRVMDAAPAALILLDARHQITMKNSLADEYLPLLADLRPGRPLTHLGDIPLSRFIDEAGTTQEFETAGGRFFAATGQQTGEPSGESLLAIRDVTYERQEKAYREQQTRLTAIGKMAAGIAHELNNVLTAIGLNSQLLLQKPNLPHSERARLHAIEKSADRAATLIQQVLDFGRRAILNRRPIDFVEMLEALEPDLRALLPPGTHVELEVAESDSAYVALADPGRIQRLLTNLVENAGQAMSGPGRLRLMLRRSHYPLAAQRPFPGMDSGPWLLLEITDDGVGIPPESLPHVFEPFFTTKGAHSASGMGLAQAYGIVKQHGGYIDIDSRPGKDTSVIIHLPIAPAKADVPAREEARAAGSPTILLVEDSDATRKALEDTLGLLKYRVLPAANGREALKLYRSYQGEIALVLADLVMPGELDGASLCGLLWREDPAAKIIVMTGQPLAPGSQLPVDKTVAWLQKPFGVDTLAKTLEQALGSE